MTRLVALDTESTGLSTKSDRLVEVAALEFDAETGKPLRTLHRYVNPQRPVPAEATQVHGLTDEFLADKPTFPAVAEELMEFVRGATAVIHNARFDVGLLDAELKRIKAGEFSKSVVEVQDTLALSRRTLKAKKHTLDALCDRFGVDRSSRTLHGALLDCELLAAVYPKLAAAWQEKSDRLSAMLPFALGSIPASLEEQVEQSLALADLASALEAERKRVNEAIRTLVANQDQQGDGWRVRFTSRETVNWKTVREQYLQGVDLKPYTSSSPSMYVERD
jgi:DNA polymerase-3 subunit epsilon